MNKETVSLGQLQLVGIVARTNNKNEMNPATAKIGETAERYWQAQLANHFEHRTHPGVTYAVYTDFESNETGDYTYFIGEVVDSLAGQDVSQFKTLTIPASEYQKFTTPTGKMPDVVIAAWQAIWAMSKDDFGGQRKYIADFEVYDHRAADPNNTVVDIYIGIER